MVLTLLLCGLAIAGLGRYLYITGSEPAPQAVPADWETRLRMAFAHPCEIPGATSQGIASFRGWYLARQAYISASAEDVAARQLAVMLENVTSESAALMPVPGALL